MKILTIFGTRPEAIKMAPIVKQLEQTEGVHSQVCVTGQHGKMLDQVLDFFKIKVDFRLEVMRENQTLNGLSTRIIEQLSPVLSTKPDWVLVHGDTTTAMAACLAAFHEKLPVAHVEAGLRTGNMQQPWPEEMNRRVIDAMSSVMFAPTLGSAENLHHENLTGRIVVTGNSVIDALLMTTQTINNDLALQHQLDQHFPFLASGRKILLVTGHRRESFGSGFADICAALKTLSSRSDIEIVYPVHLNPNVSEPVHRILGGIPNVHLIAPLDYLHFVRLMQHAHIVLTDSGGVQEEAPALGKPVLVMREVTERPEAVAFGTVRLVGTQSERIVSEVDNLLNDATHYARFAHIANPYGDGLASQRIVSALTGRPFTPFSSQPVNAEQSISV